MKFHYFCHFLFSRSQSLGPAHVQEEEVAHECQYEEEGTIGWGHLGSLPTIKNNIFFCWHVAFYNFQTFFLFWSSQYPVKLTLGRCKPQKGVAVPGDTVNLLTGARLELVGFSVLALPHCFSCCLYPRAPCDSLPCACSCSGLSPVILSTLCSYSDIFKTHICSFLQSPFLSL